jgi:hypothetical protein
MEASFHFVAFGVPHHEPANQRRRDFVDRPSEPEDYSRIMTRGCYYNPRVNKIFSDTNMTVTQLLNGWVSMSPVLTESPGEHSTRGTIIRNIFRDPRSARGQQTSCVFEALLNSDRVSDSPSEEPWIDRWRVHRIIQRREMATLHDKQSRKNIQERIIAAVQ